MTPAPLVPYDSFTTTFIGATNNIATRTFYMGGTSGRSVAIMTFTYLGSGAASDDDVSTLVTTYPSHIP